MELPSNLEKEGTDRHWWEDIGTENEAKKTLKVTVEAKLLKEKKKSSDIPVE